MTSKWLKTASIVIVGSISAFGLVACGNGGGGNNTGNGGGSGTVDITFWHPWTAEDQGPIDAVVDEFNKTHKDVHVTVVGNQNDQKLTIALAGGSPPDIILTDSTSIIPWAAQGVIEPLDSYMKQSNFSTTQFIPGLMTDLEYNGHTYALPYSVGIESALLYNKKDFQAAGIQSPPKTLSELYADAQKLTKRDSRGNITQIGFMPDYPWFDPVFWPLVFGGKFYDPATKQVTPNDPANIQALEYERKFYELYGTNQINLFKSGLGKDGTPDDPLVTGQLAMEMGWDYTDSQYRGDNGPIGVAQFPYPDGHPELAGAGLMGSDAVFIPSKAQHKQAAWEFLQWMMGVQPQILFSKEGYSIPSVTAALTDPSLVDDPKMKVMDPFFKMAVSHNLGAFPASTYAAQYAQALIDEGQKVLLGQESAAAAMAQVKQQIQPLVGQGN